MADLSKAQRKRAEARQRRRDQAEPERESAASAGTVGEGQDARHGVLQAAKVAAAAGAAGAAVAAAKALTSHDDDAATKEAEPTEEREPEEPHEMEEPRPGVEPQASEEPEADREPQPEPEPEQREEARPVAGAGPNQARQVLERAREQLEDLLGRPVESVSSLERTHDGWVLNLEVVELARIPESTDVLASYEMELDDDLNLRRYQRVRRYNRGRPEEREDA